MRFPLTPPLIVHRLLKDCTEGEECKEDYTNPQPNNLIVARSLVMPNQYLNICSLG